MSVEKILREVALMVQATMPARVLIVDDEPDDLYVFRRALEQQGFVLYTATLGHQALELLALHQPHVAVVDRRLPDMTGIDVLRVGKAQAPNTEFIILTGYSDTQSVMDALDEGAFAYLNKPLEDWSAVTQRVSEAVMRQLMNLENQLLTTRLREAYDEQLRSQTELKMLTEIMMDKVERIDQTLAPEIDTLLRDVAGVETQVARRLTGLTTASGEEPLMVPASEMLHTARMVRACVTKLQNLRSALQVAVRDASFVDER